MDVLDTWEDLSELGLALANVPIEIKYAKMLLYSLVMRCLNPILTLVSSLSVQQREPCK